MTGARVLLAATIFVLRVTTALAVQPDEQLADPVLEKRAREISAGLRCLVCQNQSIDDSDAPLARDFRLLVRQRVQAGDSEAEVRDYLVARYGDFILLRPPFRAATLLLWMTPLLVLLGGAAVALLRFRPGHERAEGKLSSEEEQEIARMVGASVSAADGAGAGRAKAAAG